MTPTQFVEGPYIGTFAKYEGLLDLCIAATQLRKARSDFKVLLVGDGPVFSEVQAYCKAHDDSGCIILRERVPFADVPRYYSLIDIAVFPRTPNEITEMVSPLKPFEAMAMGKPVIGSDVEAIAEIIQHDRTGWLFEKGNVAALKDVLETSIDRRSDLPGLGRTAREFVAEHHDWRVIARRIADGWTKLRPAQ